MFPKKVLALFNLCNIYMQAVTNVPFKLPGAYPKEKEESKGTVAFCFSKVKMTSHYNILFHLIDKFPLYSRILTAKTKRKYS